MALSEVINAVWDPIKTPAAAAAGVLGLHLWQRYLNRLAVFRWSVSYSRLAVAGATPEIGRIEVTWDDTPVTNLQFCYIELENQSGRDFTNVEVKLIFSDRTSFLGDGSVQGTAQFLPYTEHFQQRVQRLLAIPEADRPEAELNTLLSRREYTIPVFNRGSRFGISVVVHPPSLATPSLEVYCEHPGVRLVHSPERQMFLGVVQSHAAWVGLVTALAIWLAVGMASDSALVVSTVAFIVGSVGSAIGAGLIHLKRFIARTIG